MIADLDAVDDDTLRALVDAYDGGAWPPLPLAAPIVGLLAGAVLARAALGPAPMVVVVGIAALVAFAWSATRRARFLGECAARRLDPALAAELHARLDGAAPRRGMKRAPSSDRARALRGAAPPDGPDGPAPTG